MVGGGGGVEMRGFLIVAVVLLGFSNEALSQSEACSGKHLEQVTTAVSQAGGMIDQALSALNSPTDADLERIRVWFGAKNSAELQKVRQTLVNARAFLKGATFRCPLTTQKRRVYASVQPDKSFKIEFGSVFFDAPNTGFNSRAGVIVHELTHFALVGGTGDPAVGVEAARKLATTNAALAQRSAENFEYFVEATAFGLK